MGLNYMNLDERTRELMLAEIDHDGQALYSSENLSPVGKTDYPGLLRDAARRGSDDELAREIQTRLNSHEKPRTNKSGTTTTPRMRKNAHEMLAEGEFNRFYIRALCLRAIEDSIPHLIVYRAKQVRNARSASEAKIGTQVDPNALLQDLRSSANGLDTALELPPGPNSGLSVRLP